MKEGIKSELNQQKLIYFCLDLAPLSVRLLSELEREVVSPESLNAWTAEITEDVSSSAGDS